MLSGKPSIDEQVTLPGYLIIVVPSEQQSGPEEIGPENRVIRKQDGETISPDRSDPYVSLVNKQALRLVFLK